MAVPFIPLSALGFITMNFFLSTILPCCCCLACISAPFKVGSVQCFHVIPYNHRTQLCTLFYIPKHAIPFDFIDVRRFRFFIFSSSPCSLPPHFIHIVYILSTKYEVLLLLQFASSPFVYFSSSMAVSPMAIASFSMCSYIYLSLEWLSRQKVDSLAMESDFN